jgi:hypothetical protein
MASRISSDDRPSASSAAAACSGLPSSARKRFRRMSVADIVLGSWCLWPPSLGRR